MRASRLLPLATDALESTRFMCLYQNQSVATSMVRTSEEYDRYDDTSESTPPFATMLAPWTLEAQVRTAVDEICLSAPRSRLYHGAAKRTELHLCCFTKLLGKTVNRGTMACRSFTSIFWIEFRKKSDDFHLYREQTLGKDGAVTLVSGFLPPPIHEMSQRLLVTCQAVLPAARD